MWSTITKLTIFWQSTVGSIALLAYGNTVKYIYSLLNQTAKSWIKIYTEHNRKTAHVLCIAGHTYGSPLNDTQKYLIC